MGLSNYLANSRISQAGVCTSSTRPASPYEGQVIYETDTDRVLVYNNSAWVDPSTGQTGRSGMVLVKDQSVGSGVSSIIVTSAFSSSFTNYKITYTGGTGSTGAGIGLQLGPSSVGGYNSGYYRAISAARYTDGAGATAYDNNATQWANVGNTTNGTVGLSIELYGPQAAIRTGLFYVSLSYITNDYGGAGSGFHNSTNQFTDFTLTPASGTLTGGTIRVYGYNQ